MPPHALTFSSESADAANTIQLQPIEHDSEKTQLDPGHVAVQFLAFPVNPQDLMAIAGRYPVKPAYSHADGSRIAGNDGVARVERTGPGVDNLKAGDYVLPRRHGLGTWREEAILPADLLLRIPNDSDIVAASLLKMGFAPGYFLIEDIVSIRPGDWIVVNAALGVIPQTAVQFARLRGAHAIAVIREREDLDTAKQQLKNNGAEIVVTEEELASRGAEANAALAEVVKRQRIVLALDAVFGKSAERLARLLAPSGTFVNYGSLGGAEGVLPLTQDLLFWKQLKFRNFRLSQQLATRSDAQSEDLLAWFVELLAQGHLKTPSVEKVAWGTDGDVSLEQVVHRTLSKATGKILGTRKQIFVLH